MKKRYNANIIKFLSLFARAFQVFCSVAKSCHTLCDPMDCSTSGFPVLSVLKFFHTYVH